ncbi:beta-glucoside-specific PTS transporter subunit IIABC [Paraliobacillus sp. JSM ZJ581]|uniref:beta-glucoside-specific PTS transporter subunit IIABC n=1 Tax=Paraliobacillus sp. JSM ZJ581 TaxID=3342118 RepID=UPI0035A81EDB
MDYKKTSKDIYKALGEEKNILSVTHCMTRLRVKLKDVNSVDNEAIENIDGVMGLMNKGGQYQIILGNGVNKYYKEFVKLGNFETDSSNESTEKPTILNTLVDVITSCMSPLIPALIGGGMIKVLLIILPMINVLSKESQTFAILSFFGDTPFYFIPIMLAYTAAQKFKVTPMLAVTVAGIMLHPNFVALVAEGDALNVFGLPITLASYGSSVIPILIVVWLMSYIEKFFDKIIPTIIQSFAKPLLVIIVSGVLALVAIGPLGTFVGEGLSVIMIWLQDKAGWLALGVMSAFSPLIVMTGMHWAFAPIFLVASIKNPDMLILPAMLASNIAQGASFLAVSFKSRNKNTKQTALAASLSALIAGVTEPGLYGIALRFKKPLYASMLASGIMGVFAGFVHLESYSFAVPSFISLPQFIAESGNSNIINAIIVAVGSFALSFVFTLVYGFEEKGMSVVQKKSVESKNIGVSNDLKKVYSPITGELIALEKVNDPTFSEKIMGDGIAVIPQKGDILAPFSGTVSAVFPTNHAIGLTSDSGIELLIHIGINTVELNGEYFESFVQTGDTIKKGQKLINVETKKIQEAGYDITTPVIVTNTSDYIDVVVSNDSGNITNEDAILYTI